MTGAVVWVLVAQRSSGPEVEVYSSLSNALAAAVATLTEYGDDCSPLRELVRRGDVAGAYAWLRSNTGIRWDSLHLDIEDMVVDAHLPRDDA